MENKICVYTIAKNEEKFVKRWYESMREADLLVVLDTGSTDNTVQALENVGVDIVESKVIDPWRFDVARNESLKLIPEGYNILVCTDLDEVFDPGWADILRNNWNDDIHERGEYKYIWRHREDGTPDVMYRYNKIHSRNWIWRAAVHEYLTRKNDVKNLEYTPDKALHLYDKITLHHYPDPKKSRGSYLGLLKIRADEIGDEDPISIVYLGREYWFYNKYDEAIESLTKALDTYGDRFNKLVKAFICLLIGYCFGSKAVESKDDKERLKFYNTAINYFRAGIKLRPNYMENYTGLAEIEMRCQEFFKAQKTIEDGFAHSYREDSWMEDGKNWTSKPLEILAICSYKLGDKKKAIACAAKALTYDYSDNALRENLVSIVENTPIQEIIQ